MSAGYHAADRPELLDRRAVHTAGSPVTAMTIFVASEAVFFGAFFGIYMSAYADADVWPPAGVTGPALTLPTVAAAILLGSGASMAQALHRTRRHDYPSGLMPWLGVTLACAVAFVVLLAAGYRDLGFGIGDGIYQSLFYVISALELAHVVGGIVLLGLVLTRGWTGELALQRDPVLATGIYWYFVVTLGVVIYVVLYLATAG
jgi:heme/copper-type cytochrome/quinol oxidase subunit 3